MLAQVDTLFMHDMREIIDLFQIACALNRKPCPVPQRRNLARHSDF